MAIDGSKPIETALPFFSRLTFVGVAKRLMNYGYNVELTKIDVIDAAPAVAPVATVPAPPPPTATAVASAP